MSTASQVFSRRSTSYTAAPSARPHHLFINYDFRPPHLDSGARSSTVAEVSEDTYCHYGESSSNNHDRRKFDDIRSISGIALECLVHHLFNPKENLLLGSCHVTQREKGSFHHAVFFKIEREDQIAQEYVLKIPAHGTQEKWHINDNMALKSEAQLMQHIFHHTGCPVPEVIAYDGDVKNAEGAPYILMKKLDGVSAMDMWVGKSYKTMKDTGLHLNADDPLPELEQKRITFLRSLCANSRHWSSSIPGFRLP
ncbi:uncharacterized protein ALTATR162_LOCUS396 [Alternaria atra]|uniref:Aminoglycoside phosphotransferase domain-containing protein n=1 Tax=Alternaria atra TaxID=119953 RepID=A0A8J2HV02_9PLEO|nr:uncharacterized protein ALTATR162_LOCUS396 [Alternaria atra]CAG5138585.1 unnamed protein product [Alternaria atra]